MKVFLTGGAGFIGSHIAMELVRQGAEITILARDANKISSFANTHQIDVVEGDLDDIELIAASLAGHKACIHNAIIWSTEPTELQLKDTKAAVALFEAAANAGVEKLIFTSSTAVHRPFKPRMDDNSVIEPADFYGATKAAAEGFLFAFSHQSSMRCNVIRAAPTVGRPAVLGAPVTIQTPIAAIVHAALGGADIRVPAGGRQFIGVQDLAKLYAAVLNSDANRQVYLGVARNVTTWKDIGEAVIELANTSSRVIVEGQQLSFVFDTSKIERDFGLKFDSTGPMRDYLRHLLTRNL